jgi:hypothetical protein
MPRLNEQLGYGYDTSHNLAWRTNNTLLQGFTSNSRNELANAMRAGTLTVSGSVTGAVATLGVNGKRHAEHHVHNEVISVVGLVLR